MLMCVVALIASSGCGKGSTKPVSGRVLQKLVLQQTDLPGFGQFAFGRELRSELDPAFAGDPRKFGRQDGWAARYRRARRGPGPLTVASVIDEFARPSDAGDLLAAVRDQERKTSAASGLKTFQPSNLGDDDVGVATARPSAKGVRFVRVTWRRGRFVASVTALGYTQRMSVDEVVALARKQNQRLPD
jgi:hypothetical protein